MFLRSTHSHIAYYVILPIVASISVGLGIWWLLYLSKQGRHPSKRSDEERAAVRGSRIEDVGAAVGGDRGEFELQRPASVFVAGRAAGAFDARGRRLGTTTTVEAGPPMWR